MQQSLLFPKTQGRGLDTDLLCGFTYPEILGLRRTLFARSARGDEGGGCLQHRKCFLHITTVLMDFSMACLYHCPGERLIPLVNCLHDPPRALPSKSFDHLSRDTKSLEVTRGIQAVPLRPPVRWWDQSPCFITAYRLNAHANRLRQIA